MSKSLGHRRVSPVFFLLLVLAALMIASVVVVALAGVRVAG